jgi:hypothetical protein
MHHAAPDGGHSVQSRLRLLGALIVGVSITAATLALAQPRKPTGGAGKPKPRPTAAADAGESPNEDASAPASAAMTPASGDAGPTAPPPMIPTGDGGVRPSPLNPAPNEFPTGATPDAGAFDYDKLIGDIASLRARVAAVGDNLFHARIAISVRTDEGHSKLGRLVVSLDDGAVYTAPPSFRADDSTQIYAHALAAGRHSITVDVDRKDDRNDGFKNTQRSRFVVEVPKDQELDVELKIIDDSDMGTFPADQSGSYDLRVRMKAQARAVKR